MIRSAVENPAKRRAPRPRMPGHARCCRQSRPLDAHIPTRHHMQDPRFHELAYAFGVGCSDYGRRRAEVLVNRTFIVCGSVGLDVSGSSVPCVASCGDSGELDAIRGYAETVDQISRRIEDSLRADESPATSRATPVAA